ncbi:hypothetical protein Pmani_011507 [Petrolisthes manimaculis]|uniref:RRM domain-containing protein n=1 Tax=Petrolisthes manimaculis TaxID=1843537 RepID=A0AAE1UFL9_9EUCA|nr:hypothetical protein Pmani_011507 [Petrolisthes manimaculis]
MAEGESLSLSQQEHIAQRLQHMTADIDLDVLLKQLLGDKIQPRNKEKRRESRSRSRSRDRDRSRSRSWDRYSRSRSKERETNKDRNDCPSSKGNKPWLIFDEEREAKTVFFMQLSSFATKRSLRNFFSKAGPVSTVHVMVNPFEHSVCVAYITFKKKKSVSKALKMTGRCLSGQPVIVRQTQHNGFQTLAAKAQNLVHAAKPAVQEKLVSVASGSQTRMIPTQPNQGANARLPHMSVLPPAPNISKDDLFQGKLSAREPSPMGRAQAISRHTYEPANDRRAPLDSASYHRQRIKRDDAYDDKVTYLRLHDGTLIKVTSGVQLLNAIKNQEADSAIVELYHPTTRPLIHHPYLCEFPWTMSQDNLTLYVNLKANRDKFLQERRCNSTEGRTFTATSWGHPSHIDKSGMSESMQSNWSTPPPRYRQTDHSLPRRPHHHEAMSSTSSYVTRTPSQQEARSPDINSISQAWICLNGQTHMITDLQQATQLVNYAMEDGTPFTIRAWTTETGGQHNSHLSAFVVGITMGARWQRRTYREPWECTIWPKRKF